MRSAADIAEDGCPDFASEAMRTESTRNCCPSSLRRSAASMRAILRRRRLPLCRTRYGACMARSRLHELSERGVSVWVDTLSRELLETGELARLMEEDAVVGVTSNPTIFEKALSAGGWYDDQLRDVLERVSDPKEAFIELAVEDVRRACDLLRPVWDAGGGARRVRLDRGRSGSRLRQRGDASQRRCTCTSSSTGRTRS